MTEPKLTAIEEYAAVHKERDDDSGVTCEKRFAVRDVNLAADCIAFVRELAAGPPVEPPERGLTPSEAMSYVFVRAGVRGRVNPDRIASLAARIAENSV